MGLRGRSPLGHDPLPHVLLLTCRFIRADSHISPDFAFSGQVGDLEPELIVDGCLRGRVSIADDLIQFAEADDEGANVVFGEPAVGLAAALAGVAGQCPGELGLDLAGPPGDGLGVGTGVEGGLVAGLWGSRTRPLVLSWAFRRLARIR